ncbi:TPA: hypothetical protein ACKQBZ_000909 [Stenotrophomonas maltophilia]|uniref:hypothetical protein n=1 Tax=Stenotrophomonas forensis TaxID=2871169 RepID=UPI0018D4818A|nr:hypothetical protein [Stenotrophomonas maltophilia]
MISTNDFSVGSASSCTHLSLILPRHDSETAMLIGTSPAGKIAAFILTGSHQFAWFEAEGANRWTGLVFAGVRIEVDETSVFSAEYSRAVPGNLVREGTTLAVRAKAQSFGGSDSVVLESNLPSTGDLSTGFSKWQIVLGSGSEKRVLYRAGLAAETV